MKPRRAWGLRKLGLFGTALGAGLLPLACDADLDLGTRAEAGAGSTAGPESGTGGDLNDSASGGRTSGSSGRGGSQTGSGGTPNGDDSGGRPGIGGSGGTGVSSGAGGIPSDECTTSLTASTKHNYSYSSQLDLDLTQVKPGLDLTFDWGNLTRDLRGKAVDLESIDEIMLVLWNMSAEEFSVRWEPANFSSSDIVFSATMDPSATTHGAIPDLQKGHGISDDMYRAILDPDRYPPENHVYTLTATNGRALGVGTYGMAAFVLDSSSDNTEVHIDSDSAHLEYTVDLHSLAPHRVPLAVADLALDWSNLALDGRGQSFSASEVMRVNIASFSQTPNELEDRFLELTHLAERLWSADIVEQSSFNLSAALDADGAAFPGIDATHSWLVSLSCADCNDPVPRYLSVLESCGGCGDGVVDSTLGEECDDGINAGEYGGCAPTCTVGPHCGDGIVQSAYEECDSGSDNGHDARCSAGCQILPEHL